MERGGHVLFRYIISGVILHLLCSHPQFAYMGLAKSKNALHPSHSGMTFHFIPWWGYLFLAFLLFIFVYSLFKKGNSRIAIAKISTSENLSQDPITVQKPAFTVIPGNAQAIGKRTEQQDSFAFSDLSDEFFTSQYGVLAILADGMGGMLGGKEASQLAVQTFLHHYLNSSETHNIPDKLLSALEIANASVVQFAHQNDIEGKVGTTLIAAAVIKEQLYWLSVGDSRIYLKQRESLTQLTSDHVYARELDEKAAKQEITYEEAANDPQRTSLTSFIGLKNLKQIDIAMDPIHLTKGDAIILCSDGLYGSLTTDEIIEGFSSNSAQEAAEKLLKFALSKEIPNQDNVTIALLSIE